MSDEPESDRLRELGDRIGKMRQDMEAPPLRTSIIRWPAWPGGW